jgi:glycosyltransferase involved in cell wall biosynthesis
MTELVSVLISNYNYATWVADAIESALGQTYPSVEVIVCDDGSTDGSVELLDRVAGSDPRVTIVRQPNAGQGAALTAAASHSSGEILCFLDADDVFDPTKVERVVEMFERSPDAGLAIHRVAAVDGSGQVLQEMPLFAEVRGGRLREEVLRRGGRWTAAPSSALSIRNRWASSVFPIPTELVTGADAFVFGLMPLLAPVAASDEVLVRYRIHGENAYGTARPDLDTARTAARELERVVELVNVRLRELGDDARVDLRSNVAWHQQRAQAALLDEESPDARRLSFAAAGRIWRDDLWPRPVRLALSAVFALAPFVPRSFRARWLGLAGGLGGLKRMFKRSAAR